MVGVARGPGKTTCKHCGSSVGPKALKIKTSFGSYHVKCWKPPRPFELSEFDGFKQLDDAGKASFRNTVEKWLEPYKKHEKKIEAHNEIATAKHRERKKMDMGDHKALKIVEGFDAFTTIPTLVLSLIAGYLEGDDLQELSFVSKHWSTACKDDLTWKGACRLYRAGNAIHEKLKKPWRDVYNFMTNPKASKGYCVECAKPTSYNSMFACYLCQSEASISKYKTVSDLKKCGLTDADVTKYGIRATMGNVADNSFKRSEYYPDPDFYKKVVLYSLADIINAQKLKTAEKYAEKRKTTEDNEEEEEETVEEIKRKKRLKSE